MTIAGSEDVSYGSYHIKDVSYGSYEDEDVSYGSYEDEDVSNGSYEDEDVSYIAGSEDKPGLGSDYINDFNKVGICRRIPKSGEMRQSKHVGVPQPKYSIKKCDTDTDK